MQAAMQWFGASGGGAWPPPLLLVGAIPRRRRTTGGVPQRGELRSTTLVEVRMVRTGRETGEGRLAALERRGDGRKTRMASVSSMLSVGAPERADAGYAVHHAAHARGEKSVPRPLEMGRGALQ